MDSQPAVFLDRDGVLNATVLRDGVTRPPACVADLRILPGVAEAVALLADAGFLLLVVTNQPDVARGAQTRAGVDAINAHLSASLPRIARFYVCDHDTPDDCTCRKPRPGMLLAAARDYRIELPRSWMVGDRWSDVEAGRAAGCRTFLIETDHSQPDRCCPDARAADLLDAARQIVQMRAAGCE